MSNFERTVQALKSILESTDDRFSALVEQAKLDPQTAFRGANLSGADLRAEDLTRFDFTGTELSGARAHGARFNSTVTPSQIDTLDISNISTAVGIGDEPNDLTSISGQSLGRDFYFPSSITLAIESLKKNRDRIERGVVPGEGTDLYSQLNHMLSGVAGDAVAEFRDHARHCRAACMFAQPTLDIEFDVIEYLLGQMSNEGIPAVLFLFTGAYCIKENDIHRIREKFEKFWNFPLSTLIFSGSASVSSPGMIPYSKPSVSADRSNLKRVVTLLGLARSSTPLKSRVRHERAGSGRRDSPRVAWGDLRRTIDPVAAIVAAVPNDPIFGGAKHSQIYVPTGALSERQLSKICDSSSEHSSVEIHGYNDNLSEKQFYIIKGDPRASIWDLLGCVPSVGRDRLLD